MTATVIAFPDRPKRPPCADPAVCGSVFEFASEGASVGACTRCGRAAYMDPRLAELAAAVDAADAAEDARS